MLGRAPHKQKETKRFEGSLHTHSDLSFLFVFVAAGIRRLAAAAGVRKVSMRSAGKTGRPGEAARAGTIFRRA